MQAIQVIDDDGSRATRITRADVVEAVRIANEVYRPANLSFTFDPQSDFATIRSTLINSARNTWDPNWDEVRTRANPIAAGYPGKMVVFFRWGPGATPTGAGFSWWNLNFAILPGFADSIHCGSPNFKLFAHELGHRFGLPHTFGASFLDEKAAAEDFSNRNGHAGSYDGDGLADTPPHPNIYTQECANGVGEIILNGVKFDLPRQNIMSYYGEGRTITPLQAERVRWMARAFLQNQMKTPSNQGNTPERVEAEDMKVLEASAVFARRNMGGYSAEGWSASTHLWVGTEQGQRITFQFPVQASGLYNIDFFGTSAPEYAIIGCSIDDRRIGGDLDLYAPVPLPTGRIRLGAISLTAGNQELTIEALSRNPRSSGFSLGVDCLALSTSGTPTEPQIVVQPVSQTVAAQSDATFAVEAAGEPAPHFQWRKDGENIPGAVHARFNIPAANASDAGSYSVLVKNEAGEVTSASATLEVGPATSTHRAEGEELFVQAEGGLAGAIRPQDMTGFGSGWSGGKQALLPFNDSDKATMLLPVQKRGRYALYLAPTTAPYYGQIQCFLNEMQIGPVIDGFSSAVQPGEPVFLEILELEPGLQRFRFEVVGKNAASAGYFFGVDYLELHDQTPPSFALEPQSALLIPGQIHLLKSRAIGNPPFFFQWYFNGQAIPSATNESFALGPAASTHAGYYSVSVQTPEGTLASRNALISIGIPLQISEVRKTQTGFSFAFGNPTDDLWLEPDPARFSVEKTLDLQTPDWRPAPGTIVFSDGRFLFNCSEAPAGFYRVLER